MAVLALLLLLLINKNADSYQQKFQLRGVLCSSCGTTLLTQIGIVYVPVNNVQQVQCDYRHRAMPVYSIANVTCTLQSAICCVRLV